VTDVLAFDLRECRDSSRAVLTGKRKNEIAGEIIISTDAAIRNSRIYKTSMDKEIVLYIIHGILHLLGFDDHKPNDVQKMRKKEADILDYLGSKTKKVIS